MLFDSELDMERISGQIRQRETGRALPTLTVHFYFAKQSIVPPHILDETRWDELYRASWKGLDLEKIGSVISGPDGWFFLDYGAESGSTPTDPARNIWFAVTGANLSDTRGCAGVLHAACEIRTGAGGHESFLIYIAEAKLRQLALTGRVPSARDPRARPSVLQGAVASVAEAMAPPDLRTQKFSEVFAARREALQSEIAARKSTPLRPASFAIQVALSAAEGESLAPGAKIGAADGGGVALITPGGAAGRKLKYAGIHRRPSEARADTNGTSLRIDTSSGEFRLSLAEVAEDLRVSDDEGNALFGSWGGTENS
jgi:hypothetical protein